jgi:hypothetical protein
MLWADMSAWLGVGSNSNITENGPPAEIGRAAIWEIDPATWSQRQ